MMPDKGMEYDGKRREKHLRGDYGIFLVDALGNKELIYRDSEIGSLSPIPILPKPTQVRRNSQVHAP